MSALPEAWTPPAIQRSTDHQYTRAGQTVGGVTGKLKILDKSGPLMSWAARSTAEAAIALYGDGSLASLLNSVGDEGTVKALTARSSWKRDEAANIGTRVHDLADRLVSGHTDALDGEPEAVKIRAQHYAAWWQTVGWKLRLSEALIFHPDYEYGGTIDLLAYDREGRTVLADLKTGKGVYKEAVLQLTAYGMAKFIAPMGSPDDYPMPKIDRYVILHVTMEGVREIEVNVGDAERLAWLAVLDLDRWAETMKGKSL